MSIHKGFTLIEMVVTVALVAILASVVVPIAQLSITKSKEAELRKALLDIRSAIDNYKKAGDEGRIYRSATTTGYPESLDILAKGVEDQKDAQKHKIYFLRRIPRDPMSKDSKISASATWGKRAYNSEPDHPKEGDDVYDVYSLSSKTGLNGIPYHDW